MANDFNAAFGSEAEEESEDETDSRFDYESEEDEVDLDVGTDWNLLTREEKKEILKEQRYQIRVAQRMLFKEQKQNEREERRNERYELRQR